MKTIHKVSFAALAGVAIGIAFATAIHAQQAKAAPGYVISEVDEITDLPTLQKYGAAVGETLTPFHHQFIVAGAKSQALDGAAPPVGIVVIEFDSAAKAHEWYDSPAYQAIKPLRVNSTKGRMFLVDGVVPK